MISLHTCGIQFILQYLIITLNCGCCQKTVSANITPFYSPYALQVIKSQGWSPVLLWAKIIEAERFTVIWIRTRQKYIYQIYKIYTSYVRANINKFPIWWINSGIHPPLHPKFRTKVISDLFFFSRFTLYKILTFLLEVALLKKDEKINCLKTKLKILPPTICFRLTQRDKSYWSIFSSHLLIKKVQPPNIFHTVLISKDFSSSSKSTEQP